MNPKDLKKGFLYKSLIFNLMLLSLGDCEPEKSCQNHTNDSEKCDDVDECQEFGTCSQICTNLPGSYECSCLDGFKLINNTSCNLTDDSASLIIAMRGKIKVFTLGLKRGRHLYSLFERAGLTSIGVTYNARTDMVYWTDVLENHEGIWQSRLDGSDVKQIVSTGLNVPEGIAFDWIGNNIYFTDPNEVHLAVCSSDGVYCSVLIEELIDKPRDLALNPNYGLIFLTDWGKNPAIIRVGMDGSLPIAIIKDDIKWPNGIAVDNGNDRIYWTEAHLDRIESAKLDGSDRRVVKSDAQRIQHPFGIDVLGDFIYWSDWNSYNIQASKKFDGSEHSIIIEEQYDPANLVAVFHIANQPIIRRNHCVDAGCSHICTLTPVRSYQCICPVGMKLTSNNKTCEDDPNHPKILVAYKNRLKLYRLNSIGGQPFEEINIPEARDIGAVTYNRVKNSVIFSDLISKKIYEYDLTSRNTAVLIEKDVGIVNGLDIDFVSENLYWIDSESNTVKVMSLESKTQIILVQDDQNHIFSDIVVVPEKNMMFLAKIGNKSRQIVQMSMDGLEKKVLHTSFVRWRLGKISEAFVLAYNQGQGQIFWTNSAANSIQSARVDETEGDPELTNFKIRNMFPYGLAMYGNQTFWTELHSQNLFTITMEQMMDHVAKNLTVYKPRGIYFGENLEISEEDSSEKDSEEDSSKSSEESSSESFTSKITTIVPNYLNKSLEDLMSHHPCSPKSGRNPCSHICLISKGQFQYSCRCPQGLHLRNDNSTCTALVDDYEVATSTWMGLGITDKGYDSDDRVNVNSTEVILLSEETQTQDEDNRKFSRLGMEFLVLGIISFVVVVVVIVLIFVIKEHFDRKERRNKRLSIRPFIRLFSEPNT